ncbi:MAG: hypothetical protein KJ072_04840 [Verrucomicrobia bacterium]|nr:hypothetical protein [Verrucomicrobiota bacterium]
MNRRQFLAGCAAGVGATGFLNFPTRLCAAGAAAKVRIRVVYSLHAPVQPGPDWPNQGYDFNPFMDNTRTMLEKAFPNYEFPVSLANGPEQAKAILAADASTEVDGYLVFQLNCWNRVVQTIATSGKPVLYADFQYGGSGGFLTYTAAFLREQAANVGFVASSKPKDLLAAVRCFGALKRGEAAEFAAATARVRIEHTPKPSRLNCKQDSLNPRPIDECVERMKTSRILAVRDQNSGPADSLFTIPVEQVAFAELNEAWKDADPDEASAIADRWERTAARIEGVSRETLVQSAAMYLAQKAVLQRHGANAITINCLGGFYGGHIHAYPCLGFHELLNEGLIGACECDIRSTATMVAMTALTRGRPGYISDPVIDTAKRQIIYAHCVASNRAFGPDGKSNPFQILTHSEDRQGASVRSILPVGYMTTTLEVAQDRQEILLHQGKAVANDPDDRACRTKLAVEPVGDLEKLFTMWDRWGWHRVTYYGDLKPSVYALADAIGWRVVEEA